MFSFLIKKIAKNSKKQFRNAQSMVIAARIISCNLKVDWNLFTVDNRKGYGSVSFYTEYMYTGI